MNRLQYWMLFSEIVLLQFQLLHAYIRSKPLRMKYKVVCPEDWLYFDGSCFFVVWGNKKTCYDARQICQNHGAHLIKLNSQKRIDFFAAKRIRYIWIGLYKDVSTDTWRWPNEDDAATFTRWDVAQRQPNDRGEMCVNARYLEKWHDQNSEHPSNFVCEKRVCKFK